MCDQLHIHHLFFCFGNRWWSCISSAVFLPCTAYFTPCKTSLGFVIYTPTAPLPGLLSLRDCFDGKKKIHHISMHSIQINSPSRSQSVCFPSGCSKIPLLIFFPEHGHFTNTEIFVKCPHHARLSSFVLCLFLSLCLKLYKSLSYHPSYHGPNMRLCFHSLARFLH